MTGHILALLHAEFARQTHCFVCAEPARPEARRTYEIVLEGTTDAPMGVVHRRCLRRMQRHDRRQARRAMSHAG